MFDTKIAFIVRNDLATWQRMNVVAFLATGVASAAPEILGKPYVDAHGHEYGNMSIQPMLVFEAGLEGLQKAHRTGLERELTMLPYVYAMFSTGHDEANIEVFLQEDPDPVPGQRNRCIGAVQRKISDPSHACRGRNYRRVRCRGRIHHLQCWPILK